MLRVFILGPPRSATTMLYKRICLEAKKHFDVLCIFEPTNYEVLDHIARGIKHVHNTEGDVPYDYDRIPRELFEKMYRNSKWHIDWIENDYPTTPFLGEEFIEILDELDRLDKPVIAKDVHAWVYGYSLAVKYSKCKFIFTLPDFDTYYSRLLDRLKIVNVPRDKAGITKFVRLLTGGSYYREVNPETLRRELYVVYRFYVKKLADIIGLDNVRVLMYTKIIPEEVIQDIVKWALS